MDTRIDLCCIALEHTYHKLCRERGHFQHRRRVKRDWLRQIAKRLEYAELATLFVQSQFEGMSRDWCLVTFGRPFPPASVVFSKSESCWKRYTTFARSE